MAPDPARQEEPEPETPKPTSLDGGSHDERPVAGDARTTLSKILAERSGDVGGSFD